MLKQKTLKDSFSLSGKGLHTGLDLTVTFNPAPDNHGYKILSLIHICAQTKVLHFVENVRVVKDNLFLVPPLFKTIQEQSGTDWAEMYKVFNMGHRLEVYLSPEHAEEVIAISESFGIPAQIVGRIEACEQTELIIKSEFGEFRY